MSEFAGELTALVRSLAKDAEVPSDGVLTGLWAQVQELGLVTIGIAEDTGGSGGELADLMVVIRELARSGIATPIVEAATAAFATGPTGVGVFDTVVTTRVGQRGASEMTADLGVVPFAAEAGRVLVLGDDDVTVVALSDAILESVVDISGLPAARVRVERAPCGHLDTDPHAIGERLSLARTASLIGNCWGAYELTRRYVVERKQFGAALITIPSVSAGLAQMAVRIRAAESALSRAVSISSPRSGAPELQRVGAISSARIAAAQAATLVARSTHQLHGAVGITVEYGLHRYTRSLWAQRDADRSEWDWSNSLGAIARTVDEDALWDQLTA